MKDKQKVINFLNKNGYSEDRESSRKSDHRIFYRDGCIGVDVARDGSEIVLIGGEGDFLYLPCNLYACIGALIHFRAISVNYSV